jgi:hypothetical protein
MVLELKLMIIRYSNGSIREGIVLSFTANMARVALKDRDDVEEFQLVAGRWISEEWEAVVFEFAQAPAVEAFPWFEAAGDPLEPRYVN